MNCYEEDRLHGCPVYLMNAGRGCNGTYSEWVEAGEDPKLAKRMLKELKAAKKHFFGDWK